MIWMLNGTTLMPTVLPIAALEVECTRISHLPQRMLIS